MTTSEGGGTGENIYSSLLGNWGGRQQIPRWQRQTGRSRPRSSGMLTRLVKLLLHWHVQQSFRFAEQELRLLERLEADVLPADAAVTVDQEGAVQRQVLEIVITTVRLEDRHGGVREQGQRWFAAVRAGINPRRFIAYRQNRDALLGKLADQGGELVQLRDTVRAAAAE